MSTTHLEITLARLLCSTPAIPCDACLAAARLVLANPVPVLRFLGNHAPKPSRLAG
jgi:hypothetical protein